MRDTCENNTLDQIDLDFIKNLLQDEVIDSIADLDKFSADKVISLMLEGVVWNIKRIENARIVYKKMFNEEIKLTANQQKILNMAVVKFK